MHNGIITVRNTRTGNHRTFKIHTVKKGKLQGKRIVSYLFGTDNTTDYRSFGFYDGQNVIVWKQHKENETICKFAKMLSNLDKYDFLEVLHEGTCIRCNRRLTHPDSIISGIGPECAQRN